MERPDRRDCFDATSWTSGTRLYEVPGPRLACTRVGEVEVSWVFGRRSRQETEELLRAALQRLDVNAKETAVLVKTIAALKATIGVEAERARGLEATADATARARHEALAAQAADVSAALEHVASMYARLAERVEADRLERPALTEAIGRLGRQLMTPDPIVAMCFPFKSVTTMRWCVLSEMNSRLPASSARTRPALSSPRTARVRTASSSATTSTSRAR